MRACNLAHPYHDRRGACRPHRLGSPWGALLFAVLLGAVPPMILAQPVSPPPAPKPTVPELFTLEGEFVRIAYNNEGFVSLGYRTANYSVGQEWMLLDVGMTLRDGRKSYVLKRDGVFLQTPDGKNIPLATPKEYGAADLRGVQMMADATRDTINYFPPGATRRCRIGFFGDLDEGTLGYDQVELNPMNACLGRLYFRVPGGIKVGQYWLHVRLAESEVQVPFRILTKEEERILRKNWESFKEQHDKATGQ